MRERHCIVAGRSQKCISFCFHHPKEPESREIKSKFEVGQTSDCPIRARNVCDPEFDVLDSLLPATGLKCCIAVQSSHMMDVLDELRVNTKNYCTSVLDNGTLEITLSRRQGLLLREIYSDFCGL
jgi:hypothetical protein